MVAHENNQEGGGGGGGEDGDRKTMAKEAAVEVGGGEAPAVVVDTSSTVTTPSEVPPSKQQQQQQTAQKSSVHKIDYEPEVVYLYQFCRSATIPSISPFCLKVETWLRVAGIKYENVDHKMKLRSKQGKLPFVELNGAQIADSSVIIRELGKHFLGAHHRDSLDANLSREQRVIGHALESMLENHTSWVYRWWRFNNAGEFLVTSKTNVRQASKTKLPAGLVNFIVKMKLRSKRSDAIGHGIGAHTPEEIYELGEKDLTHLNEFLGDKPYFFGEEPTTLDIVAFSHLAQFLMCQGEKFPPKMFLQEKCPQLVAHVERIKERYWPDWKEMSDTLELNTHLPKPTPTAAAAAATDVDKQSTDKDEDEEDLEGEKKDKEKEDGEQQSSNGKQKNKKKNKKEKKDVKGGKPAPVAEATATAADGVQVADNKADEQHTDKE